MKKLFMSPVTSSQLRSVGYDQNEGDLYVEFKNGTVYRYSDVPEGIYEKLKSSDSPGSFFAGSIKGSYEYKKIDLLVDPEHNLKLSN